MAIEWVDRVTASRCDCILGYFLRLVRDGVPESEDVVDLGAPFNTATLR